MQKSSLILALALAFTPAVWAENVNINGTATDGLFRRQQNSAGK